MTRNLILRRLVLAVSHLAMLLLGVALGVYFLPIVTAPDAPTSAEVQSQPHIYRAQFRRDLKDSDALHWGDGTVFVAPRSIGLQGEISPGPDYKLYLSPRFVETEADFLRLKSSMKRVGDVKTFKNFAVPVPEHIDIERYDTVVVWCETFRQFITAAQYKRL